MTMVDIDYIISRMIQFFDVRLEDLPESEQDDVRRLLFSPNKESYVQVPRRIRFKFV